LYRKERKDKPDPMDELEPWTAELLVRLAGRGASRGAGGARPGGGGGLREALGEGAGPAEAPPPPVGAGVARPLNEYLSASGEYTYSLYQRREDSSIDPVMDFLLNVREGACERFASALALMLRSQGVPARVIKGYRGAERTSTPGGYQVRQSQ